MTTRFLLHHDGTLTERNYSKLRKQIPSIRVIGRAEADSRIATVLHHFPACREFRDNDIVMAQVFDFPIFAETEKLIVFDSDILIHSSPDEMVAYMPDQSADVLFEEATSPFCPRIDGVDITTRKDAPYRFTQILWRFRRRFKPVYNLPLIEDYCKFVLTTVTIDFSVRKRLQLC